MQATILKNEIAVSHSMRPEIGREFLTVSCPNGWDDVKKLTGKILLFDEKKFSFTGWNSDKNQAYFAKPLNGQAMTATICHK